MGMLHLSRAASSPELPILVQLASVSAPRWIICCGRYLAYPLICDHSQCIHQRITRGMNHRDSLRDIE
ncbi:hypothetical protein J437_LFUL009333, partial [Ladona fulva]